MLEQSRMEYDERNFPTTSLVREWLIRMWMVEILLRVPNAHSSLRSFALDEEPPCHRCVGIVDHSDVAMISMSRVRDQDVNGSGTIPRGRRRSQPEQQLQLMRIHSYDPHPVQYDLP